MYVMVNTAELDHLPKAGTLRFNPFLTVTGFMTITCHPTFSPVRIRSHQGKTLASSLWGGQGPGYYRDQL